jgi:hypothetical protein
MAPFQREQKKLCAQFKCAAYTLKVVDQKTKLDNTLNKESKKLIELISPHP